MSDSQTDTVITNAADTQQVDNAPDTGTDDLTAELEKWKSQARKHEDRAKANAAAAKELEKLREQSMTDQEKAVEEARRAARAEALAEVGTARVDDAVRVAAAGRAVDVDALLDGLDRAKFLTEDHQPDVDAVKAWVDRIAPEAPAAGAPEVFDIGQGAGQVPGLGSTQLERDLKNVLGL